MKKILEHFLKLTDGWTAVNWRWPSGRICMPEAGVGNSNTVFRWPTNINSIEEYWDRARSPLPGHQALAAMNAMQKAPAFAGPHYSDSTNLVPMEHHPPLPNLVVGVDGTTVTDDGLVVKNVQRAERINTNYEARIEAPFESWQVCRMVRRDFNFVTTKSFHRGTGKRHVKEQLRELVLDLRLQSEFFRDDVASLALNPQPDVRIVPIRLFNQHAGSIHRSMLIADKAYARINHAFKQGLLSENEHRAYCRNFELAWASIKAYLNKGQSDKSAQELGADQGIA
ncbi:hypothetical protein [Massilia sp. erpn]|uniref:hypothetical protein n=1 Tax=Massilia sp. erpn TaxID=2738142 RepID=UPI00210375CE|nr:hypothetical protein [Massilia sp. erpn]UTY55850.1 hypothetical protein HPQ68_00810 [Massilia sp. erpn]